MVFVKDINGFLFIYSIILTAILLIRLLPEIIWLIQRFREYGRNIKSISLEYKAKFQRLRFRDYIDVLNMVGILAAIMLNIDYMYLLYYLPLYLTTRMFINIVRDIIIRGKSKEGLTEFWFFVYLSAYSIVILSYIFSFSLFYFHALSLNQGSIISDSGIVNLNRMESVYYSGFTFFSMEYNDLRPQGLLKFISFVEVFGAQIILITFIGVMAGELISNIKLQHVTN